MAKNIVVCLDGTNNKLRAAVKTNVVRLFAMLDLSDPDQQVGYYDPGVGTFSSSAAWTPVARAVSLYAGLMFGAGLRQNLGEAYSYVVSVYEPGDRLLIFGFRTTRGASAKRERICRSAAVTALADRQRGSRIKRRAPDCLSISLGNRVVVRSGHGR